QLGMSHLVFHGANHTRFHHSLGALYLMSEALKNLKDKGVEISEEEAEGACIAILLHDIGHGPFSHTLEQTIVSGVNHEDISLDMMQHMNLDFNGRLETAIAIFQDQYPKKFLHQLVSSQLDMDRLDYLRRDSFYSGVSEGVVSSDRIIKMLYVVNDELVVEEKGIYSIEKFLIARRLMYWQVYLHKTVVAAEELLLKILQRAKELASRGESLFCTPAFQYFLFEHTEKEDFVKSRVLLDRFALLDDNDVMSSIKVWMSHEDKVLRILCENLINRHLPKIRVEKSAIPKEEMLAERERIMNKLKLDENEAKYFVYSGKLENKAYDADVRGISLLMKSGEVVDITEASDNYNLKALKGSVLKHFLCYYK
ncbi:MAG: HD domain-containing protein, partial [Bacteroidota bacterium]|nr:HD domain-containing protein [Bacteroidota bacterium]MDX5429732.1 HD domain-containing protein [Bacteroidota bacterium]MDX5468513.1 HD domain-containing protein [Bacteroidota bacterium]